MPITSGLRRRPAVAAVITLTLAGQVLAAVDGSLRPLLLGTSLLLLDVAGVVLSLRAGRRGDRRGDRTVWRLVALGRLLSAVSGVALLASGLGAGWWLGTVGHLCMCAVLAAAVMLGPAKALTGRRRGAFLAEAVTVLGSAFMVVWYFVINPAIASGRPAVHWLVEIGFPIGDLLMLTAVAGVLLAGRLDRITSPLSVFIGGLTCYLIGDLLFSANGIEAAGGVLVIGSMLLTVSPLLYHPRAPGSRESWRYGAQSALSAQLPLIALGIGCSLLVVVTVREHELLPWGGLIFGLVVMTGAVAARQLISQRDSRDLIVTDALTGLANRTGLENAVTRAVKRQERVALLLIDLDGFKLINDAYGHATGDTVLAEFAHLLRSTVRTGDLAARIGGDEFAVLLLDPGAPEHAAGAAQRILAAAAANPVRLGDDTLPVRASIGITAGRPADTTKELIRRADVAMYQAKRAGTHTWVLHDESMTDRRAEDAALADELEGAVSRGELHVLYQPMVDLTDGSPVAVEALVRWQHPTRGLVPPVRFIPIAERSGAIAALGLFVLEQACTQMTAWRARMPAGRRLHVSVNLSPRQLQEPTLVYDVLGVLERTGLAPQHLVLEVTESAIVDEKTSLAALRALRSHGIRIAIDDFGTGYSSLHYLTRLPVDILKIDRSFVAELNGSPEGSAITEAVIRLSQVLHLSTVAEGIETTAQAAELLALGCDTGQGYLYAKPLPAAELDERMTAVSVSPASRRT